MYPIDFLWRAATRMPSRTAIVSPDGALDYCALSRRVLDEAAALVALDPAPGSRVAIGAANSVEHLVALLAVLAAGKAWIPLNPRNGDPELRRLLDFARPSLVLVDPPMGERLAGAPWRVVPLDALRSTQGEPARVPLGPLGRAAVPLEATQAIKFTGGSTGEPKGVVQPMRAWNTCIATHVHELGLGPDDRYLVAAPITHGTSTYVLPMLAVGGSLVFPEAATPGALLDAAESHGVTTFFAPPTLVLALADAQRARPRTLPALRRLIYGGAPMRPDQIMAAQAVFGPVLCTSFGQTEAPTIVTWLPPHEMRGEALGSIGRPTLLTRLAILDPDGQPVPDGTPGEIAVRGDLVMTGYLDAPDLTREVLVGGWLRTGDGGVVDEHGFVRLRDRLRDVIISGGFNVYPGDVETVLCRHPSVAECAVVGVPDDKWGEAVHAAIRLRPGASADARDLADVVRHELGPVKTPKGVHVFDALPRNPVGKVLKRAVRDAIVERMGRP